MAYDLRMKLDGHLRGNNPKHTPQNFKYYIRIFQFYTHAFSSYCSFFLNATYTVTIFVLMLTAMVNIYNYCISFCEDKTEPYELFEVAYTKISK